MRWILILLFVMVAIIVHDNIMLWYVSKKANESEKWKKQTEQERELRREQAKHIPDFYETAIAQENERRKEYDKQMLITKCFIFCIAVAVPIAIAIFKPPMVVFYLWAIIVGVIGVFAIAFFRQTLNECVPGTSHPLFYYLSSSDTNKATAISIMLYVAGISIAVILADKMVAFFV